MTWLAALLPSIAGIAVNRPWQARPSDDPAPQVDRPDYTGLIVAAIIGVALIILMIVILRKK